MAVSLRENERGVRYISLLGMLMGPMLLAGCAAAPSAQRATAPPTIAESAAPPSPSPAARPPLQSPVAKLPAKGTDSSGSDAVVAAAVADAAARSGVPVEAVRVVRVESRDWPDSSLGCPRPGMGYAQVITPGYLIVLEEGGRPLEYHADRNRAELCTS